MTKFKNKKWENLIGKRFARLVVISCATERSPYKWNCLCDCGGTAIATSANLKLGHTKSCGCYRDERMRVARALRPNEARYRSLVGRCKKTGKEVMTFEDYLTFVGHNCHYCCAKIDWQPYMNHNKNCGSNLDRQNSDLGYIKENCVACCAECNHMKWDMNLDRFKEKILLLAGRVRSGEL